MFGYFSRGIEPTSAEGVPNRLAAGQVVFQPIASIAPGEEVVLKILRPQRKSPATTCSGRRPTASR